MTHVAVVGAGIIGAALADRLAHRGVSVSVVDSGQPGTGTSGTSLAWLNANQKLPRHYHDMSVRAMADWRRLAEGFGMPCWYVPTGSLTWAETDDQRAALSRRVERLRSWDAPGSPAPCLVSTVSGPESLRRVVNTPGLPCGPLPNPGYNSSRGRWGTRGPSIASGRLAPRVLDRIAEITGAATWRSHS